MIINGRINNINGVSTFNFFYFDVSYFYIIKCLNS